MRRFVVPRLLMLLWVVPGALMLAEGGAGSRWWWAGAAAWLALAPVGLGVVLWRSEGRADDA